MRVTLLTIGSQGDVAPFCVLARALARDGHDVQLVAPPNFSALAARSGLPFSPIGFDTRALLEEASSAKVVESGRVGSALFGRMLARLQERQTRITFDAWEAAAGSDAIIYKSGLAAGPTLAEALKVPALEIALQPMAPTRAFPPPLAGEVTSLGGLGNQLLGQLMALGIWSIGRPGVRSLRGGLGLSPAPWLPPAPRDCPTTLQAYSAAVVPKPRDWPAHFPMTGYLQENSDEDFDPPRALVEFLRREPRPLCIGFGSMTHADPAQLAQMFVATTREIGARAVLLEGWGLDTRGRQDAEHVFRIERVPHSWLFPRVAGVVHHGGAGTTAAVLRAGVPSLVVPHNFDQSFWGARVHALGAGPEPLPIRKMSAGVLAARLRRLLADARLLAGARRVSEQLRAENGVVAALACFERAIDSYPQRRWQPPALPESIRHSRSASM